jgi:hypothetical protein
LKLKSKLKMEGFRFFMSIRHCVDEDGPSCDTSIRRVQWVWHWISHSSC